MRVKIEDWVHHEFMVLDCPWEIRATIAQEPIECRVIASSIEIETRGGFLTRLFRAKPRVVLVREPGVYEYFFDGKELTIRGVVSVDGTTVRVKPDIVFKDMIEYKSYLEFVRHVYEVMDNTVNKALGTISELLASSLSVLGNNLEIVNNLARVIAAEGSYNANAANLFNTVLSGMGISIDTAVQVFNEIMEKYLPLLRQQQQQQVPPGVVGQK